MKKLYFLLSLCCFSLLANSQTITFSSAAFKTVLLNASPTNAIAQDVNGNNTYVDANHDGNVTVAEAAAIYKLSIASSYNVAVIYNVVGIEYFVNLRVLDLYGSRVSGCDLSVLTHLEELYCNNIGIGTVPRNINITGLNLTVFEHFLTNALSPYLTGTDGNGGLSQFPNLKRLVCSGDQLTTLNLSGLTNLEYLNCNGNLLTTLDLTGLNHLTEIACYNNKLTTLDLAGHNTLVTVDANTNKFTNLTVSALPNLKTLNLATNALMTGLTLNNLNSLESLDVRTSALSSLTLTGTPALKSLLCQTNQLTSLDLNGFVNLEGLTCNNNLITTLDLSSCTKLASISCSNNNLTSLFIKNGIRNYSIYLNISNNPALQFICCDDDELADVQSVIGSNCNVNTYCSFVPGGTYYTIEGANRFDNNSNGCDVSDLMFKNLKLKVTSGTTTGYAISNQMGHYSVPLLTGTYTITPQIENANYFITTPTSRTVTFPAAASPTIQDFCFSPNGSLSDIGIYIFPMQSARPGFDATYKLVYKNKGNKVQSGVVNLTFDDALLNFISATPAVSSQAINMLSWNYINLFPFETREIELKLHVNAPTDTPPVSSGTLLSFNAAITDDGTDLFMDDNTDSYNQYAVNSFDPNDKTCLEGAAITPEMVGKEVTYIIRFENSGTANAQNIVVKDMIDTTKFDINTLIPISGSHSFATKISNTNKVEFIFENINLPFDDANNDGYVAFKIKTKPTLVLGNTFSNTASIYFDYNFPIVTNTATTTIALLTTKDFEFESYFKIYPNPAKDVLNIVSSKQIEASSISIYNTLGQLILVVPNAKDIKAVDVSSLKTGNYFIKVVSDKGTSNAKFIKQ